MVYSFQKQYTLIAQTPMIHFQYGQAGATLRATEVKPKLDKYLLECAKNDNIDRELLSQWSALAPDKKTGPYTTFHYKMKIERKGRPTDSKIAIEDCKFYFGNQGDNEKKDLVFNNCELQITCFIPELMEFIDKHIGAFFVLHNFGTRQTKGFGGFSIKGQSDEEIDAAIKSSKQLYFYADIPDKDKTSVKNRLNHALTVYSIMKAGLNLTRYNENEKRYMYLGRYIKGFTMRPCLDKGVGSDKAFIKSKVHTPKPVDDQKNEALDRDYNEYVFIRALLGLSEKYEFRDRYRNNGSWERNGKLSYNPVGVDIINCPANEDGSPKIDMNKPRTEIKELSKIQRFASPVTIKIYQNRIYFLFNDSYKQMLNQSFLFLSFSKKGKAITYESISDCIRKKHYISTPKSFDMKDFIEKFISYYNDTARVKLEAFVERNAKFDNPYHNSKNLTLKKGW